MPIDPSFPRQVTELVDIGFEEGRITILDLGYAFHVLEGGSYDRTMFPQGTPLPPELLGNAKTSLLFKVDS